MGLLNSALQIGRSALLGYQGALQVVGNNISSAASPDYTRLTPQFDPLQGNELTRGLQPGAGVALSDIQRHLDEALESRLRLAISDGQSAEARLVTLGQVESFFNDLTGTGVGSRLQTFLHGFDELQNAPEDSAVRDLVIANGAALSESLHSVREQLEQLGEAADAQIADVVAEANHIIEKIADLNERITRAEARGPGTATGLRDQRDALLRRLAEFFDVTTQQQPDGAINVYLGSEALAQGSMARGLATVSEMDGSFERTSIRFADTGSELPIHGGRLHGILIARDEDAYGRIQAVDELAAAIIGAVNRIHADGQGLRGFTTVTGTHDLLATDVALNDAAAGLGVLVNSGSFFITVTDDATQTPSAYEVPVVFEGPTPTTLASLVDTINAQVEGVNAGIRGDHRLVLTADTGYTFTFGHDGQQTRTDTSHLLAAMGINTFFSGNDAAGIAVNPLLAGDPRLIGAASTPNAGDGIVAGRIAALDANTDPALAGRSLPEFVNSISNDIAVDTAAGRESALATDAVLASLQAQKDSISGVSLDEEAISLLKFERAFQGTSRFISVVDDLLGELVSLIR